MSGHDDFAAAREALMAQLREELGDPPTPEELLAWRDGRLGPAERERIEALIAVHPEAARALADLAAFPDLEPDPDTPELPDEDAGWRSFRARLADLPPSAPAPAAPPRPLPWRLAAAAILLLTVGYLAGRMSAPDPARKPALNAVIAQLEPAGEDGLRSSSPPVELPSASDELLLVLSQPGTEELSGYSAEIFDQGGRQLWAGEGLQPTELGTFHLSFPRETFAPGTYRIDLFGQDGTGRKRLAIYELRVALTPGPHRR